MIDRLPVERFGLHVSKVKAAWLSRAGLGLGILLAAGLFYTLMPLSSDRNVDEHRKMQTIAKLELVGQSLDEWVTRQGRVPGNDEALGVLELRKSPVLDGWGHPLIYKVVPGHHGGRKFQLRSAGPNGLDDGGDGDDLTLPAR